MSTVKDKSDRRESGRMPIERDVRYKIVGKKQSELVGNGRTVNMSSSGVLFATDQWLAPGKRLELSIGWPVQLNDHVPLRLVARGTVVRSEHGQAAIEIHQHEFRTQGSHVQAVPRLHR